MTRGAGRPARRSSGRRSAGFSLVEVLVALVVLEVGLLGVVGVAVLAERRLAEAATRVRAVGAAEALADSLIGAGRGGAAAGEAVVGHLLLRWTADEGGVRVEVVPSGGGEEVPPLYVLDATPGVEGSP